MAPYIYISKYIMNGNNIILTPLPIMEPRILVENTIGKHNEELEKSIIRIDESKMYEDLSTVIICPTRGTFPTRVVQSWMKLMKPMNQQTAGPIFAECMKVDEAYNALIEYILGNPYLSQFKYVLTIEEDNLPPPDGLLQLYKSMDKYDVVSGLYWSKSDDGFPMIFGNPEEGPDDSKPQPPKYGEVQQANALGMGFNLFKLDIFRKLPKPWFKTVEAYDAFEGLRYLTQDIYFYKEAAKHGFKFACDNRVLVGHLDQKTDKVW
jgi:hypothetical protein